MNLNELWEDKEAPCPHEKTNNTQEELLCTLCGLKRCPKVH